VIERIEQRREHLGVGVLYASSPVHAPQALGGRLLLQQRQGDHLAHVVNLSLEPRHLDILTVAARQAIACHHPDHQQQSRAGQLEHRKPEPGQPARRRGFPPVLVGFERLVKPPP